MRFITLVISAVALTSTIAQAQESSSRGEDGAISATLPENPQPNGDAAVSAQVAADAKNKGAARAGQRRTLAKVLTNVEFWNSPKVKFRTSTELSKEPSNSGPISFRDESLGVTFGDVQISDMLAQSGIPNTPDTKVYFNVDVTVAPAASALAKAAGAGAIADIQKKEAGMPWEQGDIDAANARVKTLQLNGLQTITVSAAVVTKDGRIFSCEVGRSPVSNVPVDSPDKFTSYIENATGSPSDALRVGSSFTTSVGTCTAEKSLKNFSKFAVGIKAYKDTLPYGRDLNTTMANTFFANNRGFEANKFGAPNTFVGVANYTNNINANNYVTVNGVAGVTTGAPGGRHPVSMLSGSVTTHGNTFFGAVGESYYTSMTGTDPTNPVFPNYAVKQKGQFAGYTRPVFRNINVVGVYEKDRGVPNSANANTASGIVNYNLVKGGLEYVHVSGHNKDGDMLSPNQGRARLTIGADYQNVTSPDGSLAKTGPGVTFHVKLTTTGPVRATLHAIEGLKTVLPKSDDATVSTSATVCTSDPNFADPMVPRCPGVAPAATAAKAP